MKSLTWSVLFNAIATAILYYIVARDRKEYAKLFKEAAFKELIKLKIEKLVKEHEEELK